MRHSGEPGHAAADARLMKKGCRKTTVRGARLGAEPCDAGELALQERECCTMATVSGTPVFQKRWCCRMASIVGYIAGVAGQLVLHDSKRDSKHSIALKNG